MIRWLLLLAFMALPAAAQEVPARLGPLSDYAGVLTQGEAARIEGALEAGRQTTGVEVAVVLIAARRDYGGAAELKDFATSWFNTWGLGDARRNDGILILVARDDRELRVALGSGYPARADAVAQEVIDDAMLRLLRDGRLAEGIEAGVLATYDRLARPFAAGEEIVSQRNEAVPFLMFLGMMAGVWLWKARRILGDRVVRLRRCPACGQRALHRHRTVAQEPGETTKGEMKEHTTCGACGDDRVRLRPIPSLSAARSGGSSSSGGGGRSSGGGASGRW